MWTFEDDDLPLIFAANDNIYSRNGIDFNAIKHLENMGFIQYDGVGISALYLCKHTLVSYYGKSVELTLPKDSDNKLSIGQVLLTQAGRELAKICSSTPVEGFFEYICDKWTADSEVLKIEILKNTSVDNS